MDDYWCLYRESIADPETYWAGVAESFHWYQPWDRVHTANLNPENGPISIRWFEGATTSIAYNCLDRHLNRRADQPAIFWEGLTDGESRTLTYRDLHTEVCKCANALTSLGVQKGDVVTLFMPMIPEFPIAMLACARIGAIHNAVFSGFSADILSARLEASESHVVLTAAGIVRGDERDCLKATVDQAIQNNPVNTCLVVDRPGFDCPMQEGRDHWWHDVVPDQSRDCPCEEMDAEDPLFILYTGGASSSSKGVLHTTGEYMIYAASTHRNVFDCHDGDIHFCVADDIAWITGHSYTLYGPLANGGTVLIAEHPTRQTPPNVYWKLIDQYKVTQLYTLYEDHDRFEREYFRPYPGYYFTGDTCRRDEDGYYWILGRISS